MRTRKIVFFAPYPVGEAPSQRFRFEQYFSLLNKERFDMTLYSFYNQSDWAKLYTTSRFDQGFRLCVAVFRTLLKTAKAIRADFVFVHREVMPIGPPLMEWIITQVFRKKLIYDFDDAIWMTDNSNETRFEKILRWRSKVASICRWSYKVSVGNEYLASYARRFNNNVIVNPTTIDTVNMHNQKRIKKNKSPESPANEIIIGWTGSHSTIKYLEELGPVLRQVENQYPQVSFLVIADRVPDLKLKNLVFKKWTKESEIEDLIQTDIGIMPLPDDEWAKGKCGFKALQYMALGIPCLASPVGVNTTIIKHGINGFLCDTEKEWIKYFDNLINNKTNRREIGQQGRTTVENNYSVRSNTSTFLSLFE